MCSSDLVAPQNGFDGKVTFSSVSGLPSGVVASLHPDKTASSLTLAVSAAIGSYGTGTPVDLSSAFNVNGIYTDGTVITTSGLDGSGDA